MGFHHVAFATKDLAATHTFYTEAMGFELVKVASGQTPTGGWSKHVFYDTGANGLMAFWELHDDTIGDAYPTDLSRSFGLPAWVNHLAFEAATREELDQHRQCWLDHGITVPEVDHEFCTSIYAMDPNGIMVEWCLTTRVFDDEDRRQAAARLNDPDPSMDEPPAMVLHKPTVTAVGAPA